MIHCKKYIIATCFTLMLPMAAWSEAPVVDDSDNFAIIDGQQGSQAPVGHPKYDEPEIDNAQTESYSMDDAQSDDGPALAQDDQVGGARNNVSESASLIDKIQSLQQEVQELRGQLEVQAHDLKLLQQQQVAFYKDLDSRLGNATAKSAQIQSKAPTDISMGSQPAEVQSTTPTANTTVTKTTTTVPQPVVATSRANPADEQISYLAAYELVKNKRYDDAITAMETFVQKYPKGGYTANAQYWLGELFMVKRQYPQAIEHFEIVLQQFPSSSKSAASMLKTGYAYTATGDKQEAKKRFQQVVKNYPGTPTAQLANTKLQALN